MSHLTKSSTFSFPSRAIENILSCLVATKTLTRWKTLTKWWQDRSHDVSCPNSENWTQTNVINRPWNWRLTVFKSIKMSMIRPTKFKMAFSASCTLSTGSPLPLPTHLLNCLLKALAHWLSVGGMGLWTWVCSPPITTLQNKANLPFQKPCLFIGICMASSQTLLSVTLWASKKKKKKKKKKKNYLH